MVIATRAATSRESDKTRSLFEAMTLRYPVAWARESCSSCPPHNSCGDNRLDTSVASEEHISDGNKLGIIDRLVRTLREPHRKIIWYHRDRDLAAAASQSRGSTEHTTGLRTDNKIKDKMQASKVMTGNDGG
jgi:hypothetical protein